MQYRIYFLIPVLFHLASALLDAGDQRIYENIFKSSFPYKNLETAYRATSGLSKLGVNIGKQEKICDFVKKEMKQDELASLFFATSIKRTVKKCKYEISKQANELIARTIATPGDDVTALYYALESQKNLGTMDKFGSLADALRAANRSTVVQHARVLKVATFLPEAAAAEFLTEIATIVDRADETEITRYFAEGFSATVEFLTHAYALAEYVNEKAPITPETIQKFLTEIEFHRDMETVVDNFGVLSIMSAMNHSSLYSPISVRLPEDRKCLSNSNSNLDILVTDLMNNPAVTGVIVGVRDYIYGDKKTESVNKQMRYISGGIYRLVLSSLPPVGVVSFRFDVRAENRYIPTEATLRTKVITTIKVEKLLFSIREREHTKAAAEETATYPGRLPAQQSADHHQIIVIKLDIFDIDGAPFRPEQVFACFVQNDTSNEVFFIGQPSTSGEDHYVINIDLGAVEKESFRSISGVYELTMLLGDALISNPTKWVIGDIDFTFHPRPPIPEPEIHYGPLPEIHHKFKSPEPRPPFIVSTVFSAIVLSPWLILLVMWPKVGANLRNMFSFGLSGIVFQISLVSIAGLYCLYWWQLNMFQTLFYLALISIVTFLSGHRTLKTRAANRMAK